MKRKKLRGRTAVQKAAIKAKIKIAQMKITGLEQSIHKIHLAIKTGANPNEIEQKAKEKMSDDIKVEKQTIKNLKIKLKEKW